MTTFISPMQSYYSARAAEYDGVYLKPERQADLRALERWLPPIFAKAAVLEVACGTGYWTQFIAPKASRILATDTAPETLRIARERVPETTGSFLECDAYAIPTHLKGFNAAFAGFWFSHVPRTRQREFLVSLGAALEPHSKVVLLDNRYVGGSSSPITDHDCDGNSYQARRLNDGSIHRVLKNFPTEAELIDLVAGLGNQYKLTTWQYFWAFEYRVATP